MTLLVASQCSRLREGALARGTQEEARVRAGVHAGLVRQHLGRVGEHIFAVATLRLLICGLVH
jgi:hypothetical protein